MSYEFRTPSLTAATVQGQLGQLTSFLRQHIEQLNWVVKGLDAGDSAALTQAQRQAAEAAAQSPEVFQSLYRRICRKQAQENFVGAAKRTVLEGGSLAQGQTVDGLDAGALERYTVFVAVSGGAPVVCARQGGAICGPGLHLTWEGGTLTVTAAESPVTALYAVI